MWNSSFSFECGEDKTFFPNPPNLSSYFSGKIEGAISCFPSSPLYDSSHHEDPSILDPKLSDHGCRDIFIRSSDHDYNYSIIDLSKPSVFDGPSSNELEYQARQ